MSGAAQQEDLHPKLRASAGRLLRIDPDVVKKLATENPLYGVSSRDEIDIEIGDAFKKESADRPEAVLSYGIAKSEVDAPSLTH